MVEDIEEGKMALATNKNKEKEKLQMGPIIETLWSSKVYFVPVDEAISLVGKSVGMLVEGIASS